MRARGDRLRRAVRQVHLWLGLGLGGLFALLGLTGSVLAFYPEIDALLHPEIRVESVHRTPPDWDRALATVRRAFPDKAGPWRFEDTRTTLGYAPGGSIPARYYDPPERAGSHARMMVWLSPDGTQVLRRDYWGEYAMTFIYDLHFRLLLGETGGQVLGWTGLALLALLLSGLWAWWPRGSWAKALRIKRGAAAQRVLRDWHKLSGLGGLALLLLLTGTGVILELPKQSDAVLGAAGLRVDAAPHVPKGGMAAISAALAVRNGMAALPGGRLAWVETPPVHGGAWKLRVQVPGDPAPRFPHSFVWVDAASGRVLAVQDARTASGGTSVNNWIHPLHDGSVLGIAGRVVIVLTGLVPLLLFVTGVWRWLDRRRAREARWTRQIV